MSLAERVASLPQVLGMGAINPPPLIDRLSRWSIKHSPIAGWPASSRWRTGIYAVIAHAVGQRARQIGIRLALGARPSSILVMVVRQGLGFVAVGLTLGLALAAGLGRLLPSLLFGIAPADPATLLQVAGTVAAAASIACALPTVRALRVDAMLLKPE